MSNFKSTAINIGTGEEVEVKHTADYFESFGENGYLPDDVTEVLTKAEFEGLYKIKD
jgi:hypothetical protein